MLRKFSSAKSLIFKAKLPSKEIIKKDGHELSPIEKVADTIIEHQLNLLMKMDKLTIWDKLTNILFMVVSVSSNAENKKATKGFALVQDTLKQLTDEGVVKSKFNEERLYETVIKRLIVKGADVNKANDIKRTPLHFAAENMDHGDVAARILIANKAHLKARDILEYTPLDLASANRYYKKSREVIYNAEKKLPSSIRSHSFGAGSPHLSRYKREKNPSSFNSDNTGITSITSTSLITESNKLAASPLADEKLTESIKYQEIQRPFQKHHAKSKVKTLITHFEGLKS